MNLGEWKEIGVETEDGEVIANIIEDTDTPIICKEGYLVRLVPKQEGE